MQEIIVLLIALFAALYLGFKFLIKSKKHDCDKCGLSENSTSTK